MTFSYDLADADETIVLISKVRLEIGDTVSGVGVKPDGSNISDEEITVWLDDEDNSVMKVVARACDALARMWALVADTTVGPRRESFSQISARWQKQADALKEAFGIHSGSAFSAAVKRVDGYSESSEADDYS